MMWSTAAARIAGAVERTPLIEARLDGHTLWLKCENRQTGGAFKLRGASNRLLAMSAEERARGVVAFSSGNHAQGVAIAARRLGMKAVIVMPSDAPALKVEGTRSAGRRDRLLRPAHARIAMPSPHGSPPTPGRRSCRASTTRISSPGRGRVGTRDPRPARALAGADRRAVRRRRAGGGDRACLSRRGDHRSSSPRAGTTWGGRCAAGRSSRSRPTRRRRCATRCRRRCVSPITFGVLRERKATALSVSDAEACAAIALGVARAST